MSTKLAFHLGNCVAGMAKLPAGSVDVVVTSPPYNLGIDYGKYDDCKTKQEYLAWTLSWATQTHRALSDDGSFFLNVGGSPSNPLLPHEVLLKLSSLFHLQNTIHWIKSITVRTPEAKEISAGHFKPINSRRFVNDCHEYIFHLTKNGNTPLDRLAVGVEYADKSNIRRWSHTGGSDKRCRGNNWYIPYETIQNRLKERPHPATFPVELPAMCIRLHGWRSDLVVLDPFLGIGSSAVAAQRCNVGAFIGYEIDECYLETARERVRLENDAVASFRSIANEKPVLQSAA